MKNIRTRVNNIPALNVMDKTVVRYASFNQASTVSKLNVSGVSTSAFFLNIGTVSTHFHFS